MQLGGPRDHRVCGPERAYGFAELEPTVGVAASIYAPGHRIPDATQQHVSQLYQFGIVLPPWCCSPRVAWPEAYRPLDSDEGR